MGTGTSQISHPGRSVTTECSELKVGAFIIEDKRVMVREITVLGWHRTPCCMEVVVTLGYQKVC